MARVEIDHIGIAARDPEHVDNGLVSDPLGGPGRVYFVDPDGHLFEVVAT